MLPNDLDLRAPIRAMTFPAAAGFEPRTIACRSVLIVEPLGVVYARVAGDLQAVGLTDGELGSMGSPIKALVDGKPLYLCCKGCLGKVQRDPDAYLRKASQANEGSQGNGAQ